MMVEPPKNSVRPVLAVLKPAPLNDFCNEIEGDLLVRPDAPKGSDRADERGVDGVASHSRITGERAAEFASIIRPHDVISNSLRLALKFGFVRRPTGIACKAEILKWSSLWAQVPARRSPEQRILGQVGDVIGINSRRAKASMNASR